MKILMIHQGYEMYGSDKMFIQSAEALRFDNSEHEIDIWIPKKGLLYEFFLKQGFNVKIKKISVLRKNIFSVPSPFLNAVRFIKCLILNIFTFIKVFREYDSVYINTITIIDATIASRFSRAKTYIHVHEISRGITLKVFSNLLSFSRAHLIFISNAVADNFSAVFNNSSLLLNGVPEIDEKILGVDKPKLRILLMGRINSWKGHNLLIEAISILPNQILKGLELHIVGDVFENQNFYKEELLEKVRVLNLDKKVIFHPFSNTPEDFYNWANIIVVPSTNPEPFGLVAIEAMSLAKTVVVANHGGLKEIVTNELDGLTFIPNSAGDLADKIEYLYSNDFIIKELGLKAKETFQKRFSVERYMIEFSNIILR